MTAMSAFSCRIGSVSVARLAGVALAAALGASVTARACDPPRVVGLATTFTVGDGETPGSFSLDSFFVEPHATFEVSGTSLPIPLEGFYRLVLVSATQSIDVGSFDVDDTGTALDSWDLGLDMRDFVLEVDRVELHDGDVVVASTPARSRGQVALFAEGVRRGGQAVPPRLTFNGFIERRSVDYSYYDLRIDGVKVPRGEYVLELAGLTDSFQIPFTSGSDRRVSIRLIGTDQDLLTRSLDWTLVRILRGDEVVATLPLECR
jgi:hypothetical protein